MPQSKQQPYFTSEQMQQIVRLANDPHSSVFLMLANTGMRIGELRHLEWDDIDFDRRLIHIRAKDDWHPKAGSARAVPMTDSVRLMLESRAMHEPRFRWVFLAPPSRRYGCGGQQVSERRLLAYLKRILRRLGLQGHLHSFRHSFITDALTRGIPVPVVREWVGHVDPAIIDVYTHINNEASQAAMQRLERARTLNLQQNERLVKDGQQDDQEEKVGSSAQIQHTKEIDLDDDSAN